MRNAVGHESVRIACSLEAQEVRHSSRRTAVPPSSDIQVVGSAHSSVEWLSVPTAGLLLSAQPMENTTCPCRLLQMMNNLHSPRMHVRKVYRIVNHAMHHSMTRPEVRLTSCRLPFPENKTKGRSLLLSVGMEDTMKWIVSCWRLRSTLKWNEPRFITFVFDKVSQK